MTKVIHYRASRRYYITGDARYVSLKELRTWVREGRPFKVTDYRTKLDSTNATLIKLLSLSTNLSDDSLITYIRGGA